MAIFNSYVKLPEGKWYPKEFQLEMVSGNGGKSP
jgi:hypothetical protein